MQHIEGRSPEFEGRGTAITMLGLVLAARKDERERQGCLVSAGEACGLADGHLEWLVGDILFLPGRKTRSFKR